MTSYVAFVFDSEPLPKLMKLVAAGRFRTRIKREG